MTMSCRGASLVELLMAMGVTAATACAMLSMVVAGQSLARIQPEQADQQQRARITAHVIGAELARAGSGLDRGSRAGSLARYFPPISVQADGGLTIWYLTGGGGHATLASSLDPDAVDVALAADPACAPAPSCRFREDATAVLFDDSGCHDVARIERAGPGWLVLRSAVRRCAYSAGASIAEGEVRTYRIDAARQLVRRDEATGVAVPVIDHVGAMATELLDSGQRVRIAFRFAPSVIEHLPDLAAALDVRPANLREE